MAATTFPLGALILHGFSSSLDTVNGLVPRMERLGVPYRMPVLRGHESRPEDLAGVRWEDWVEDARRALAELLSEADRAVVIGLSMGGLVAALLAADQPAQVDSLVLIAPALRLANPLSPVLSVAARVLPWLPVPPENAFEDRELAKASRNYRRVPTRSVLELLELASVIRGRLPEVRAPLLVVAPRKDRVVATASAEALYQAVSSEKKELVWFEGCGHEMLQDLERDAVMDRIEAFVSSRRGVQA